MATMALPVVAALTLLLLRDVGAGQTRPQSALPAETYESVVIDASGSLVITTSEQKIIVVPKQGEQSSFSEAVVSSARMAVGAPANFPNCCTSYDIPLQLVVYANGTVHRFTGNGLPISQWHFADGGRRVALGQEPVHFGCQIHYELRDIESERLIDSVDVPQACGQIPEARAVKIPQWVIDLTSRK
jgi:hypothetical protein